MSSSISKTTTQAAERSDFIKREARLCGFNAVGICKPESLPSFLPQRLQEFLANGYHGDMAWLDNPLRADPKRLWDAVTSVVVVGLSYAPGVDPLRHREHDEIGVVSVYAQGADYHDILKRRLKALARSFIDYAGGDVKVFVDTAPVMEKPLAQIAGLGWQGKHTNLVSRQDGSWLFLGVLYTTLDLIPDAPHQNYCGSCTACQTACPTNAFIKPYQLDARRCISYLTIEHKGHIPRDLRRGIGNRIYGCDDCLAVCPWNKFAKAAQEISFTPRLELLAPSLSALAWLDDAQFRQLFAGSPIKRIGRDRFIRNVLIALGNTKKNNAAAQEDILDAVRARLDDPSPLVRAAAAWALTNIAPPKTLALYKAQRLAEETDPEVKNEWINAPHSLN